VKRGPLVGLARRALALVALVAVTLFVARAWQSELGPPLRPWHTHVPRELRAKQIDATDWDGYVKAEASILARLRAELATKLDDEDRVPANRYFDGSPLHPGSFEQDWNRSFVLAPDAPPAGAAVLLHGMTDSPYSVRHLARLYRARGFVAVAIRLPAHGTVPGALTDVAWEDWLAATRLAVREAVRRSGPARPLHVVGYSLGGALAVKYALDALGEEPLPRPDRLVLVSPMIGVTTFARFAGAAGLPAVLPAFAKAAWLGVVPEFNPFKYNSFPVNAARQAHRLTAAIQAQVARDERDGRLLRLPPVLTFQSVLDATVSTGAVVSGLYARLPSNGSELVLFEANQAAQVSPLLRSPQGGGLDLVLPPPPRRYRTTIVANAGPGSLEVVARTTEAGGTEERRLPLGASYPADVYSLSHVALPFPDRDGLYGTHPDPSEDFGINLGAIAARGERGALVVGLDSLMRASSNPFFCYVSERIDEGLGPPVEGARPCAS
jgi:alpha-beta hydrolase superfamily lysophospholipase